MSFKKPFRAVPIKLGHHYRQKQQASDRRGVIRLLGIAAAAGVVMGVGSVALNEDGRTGLLSAMKPLAVRAGIARVRAPRPGDVWNGCNEARSAGTAPIYAREPGYSETMDGDGDGIACEPIQ